MAFTIKFRIWDNLKKEFVFKGYSLNYNGHLLYQGQEVQNPNQFVIHLFSGVLDKYNKEIFEEDIVEHTVAEGGDLKQFVGIVRYDANQGMFILNDGDIHPLGKLFSLRKIGNPYENAVLYDLYLKNKKL